MNLVLFRHAQKSLFPFDDPHLTEGGFQQAEALARLVEENRCPHPTELWTSPRIRTEQTLFAIAKKNHLICIKKTALDLQENNESRKDFRQRVQKTIDEVSALGRFAAPVTSISSAASSQSISLCIYLCTHYDWIEEAMSLIPSDADLLKPEFAHWAPAQSIQFQIQDNGIWKFIKKMNPP